MLTEVTIGNLEYIALHMRGSDWLEIRNLLDHDSPVKFAWQAYHQFTTRGRARIAWHDGRPAVCVAFVEHRPGVWDIAMFGTDALKPAMKPVLRWIRETVPELRDQFGGCRLQADSHEDHHDAHRFLRGLGARPEATMRRFGKDGSTYLRFVWISDEQGNKPLLGEAA